MSGEQSSSETRSPYLICRYCGKSARDLNRDLRVCDRCRSSHYCSRSCQRSHWKEAHKHECSQRYYVQAIYEIATRGFEQSFARWVRRCQKYFAMLVLRLSYEGDVVTRLLAKPAKSFLRLALAYDEKEASFHIRSVHFGTPDELEDEELRAAFVACAGSPAPGSTDSGRRVWAVTIASCTCRRQQLTRVVPMSWVPRAESCMCQPAWLSCLPDSAMIVQQFPS